MFYPVFVKFLNKKSQYLMQNLTKSEFLGWSCVGKFTWIFALKIDYN
jgi:hypothetical protein